MIMTVILPANSGSKIMLPAAGRCTTLDLFPVTSVYPVILLPFTIEVLASSSGSSIILDKLDGFLSASMSNLELAPLLSSN